MTQPLSDDIASPDNPNHTPPHKLGFIWGMSNTAYARGSGLINML